MTSPAADIPGGAPAGPDVRRGLICTATYNEVDIISDLVFAVARAAPDCDILVIDDASPDGTGALLREMRERLSRLIVIHRPHKMGIGSAHQLAIRFAAGGGYRFLVTLDADFSHDPGDVPRMIRAIGEYDFVIGSRFAKGGRYDYRGIRRLLSAGANLFARALLRIPLRETTTSFRAYSRPLLQHLARHAKLHDGYSFFFLTAALAARFGRHLEIPIHFHDRREGATKISQKEIGVAALRLIRAWWRDLVGRPICDMAPDGAPEESTPCPSCGAVEQALRFPERRPPGAAPDAVERFTCSSPMHGSHAAIVECLRCGLAFSAPMPPDAELDRIYARVEDGRYVENLAARERTFRYNWGRVRPLFPPPRRLLDIGCHCGGFLKLARESGYDVEGLEPSAWSARYCRETLGIPVQEATIGASRYDPGTFDIITAWDVLEHLRAPGRDLEKLNALLRLGGKLIFSTLDVGSLYARVLGERWPWYIDMHLLYFDETTLANVLREAGFHVARSLTYRHIVTLDYVLYKLDALKMPGASAVRGWLPRWISGRVMVPFALGDIRLTICTKVREAHG